MGASARTLDVNFRAVGVDAVRSGIRMVRTEAATASAETATLNETAVYGLGEVSRGITNLGMAGHVTSMSVRELSGGVMRLGSLLGPGAGLAGIAVMAGGLIAEVFQKMKSGMSDTEAQFNESLARMINAGNVAEMKKQAQDLYVGTPAKQFKDGITALQRQATDLRAQLATALATPNVTGYGGSKTGLSTASPIAAALELQLHDAEELLKSKQGEFDRLKQAILDTVNVPLNFPGILPMKSTAKRPLTAEQLAKNDEDAQKLIDFADSYDLRLKLQRLGVQSTPGWGTYDPSARDISDVGRDRPRAAKIIKTAYDQMADEAAKQQNRLQEQLQTTIADAIGNAIVNGIQTGIRAHSIGGAFTGLTRSVLAAMGGMMISIGEKALLSMQFIQKIADGILRMDAGLGIPAALGLIALGATLQAAGSSGGGGSRSYSSATPGAIVGAPVSVDPRTMSHASSVTPQQPVTVNATFIGKHDPTAQRELLEMISLAQRRGSTPG